MSTTVEDPRITPGTPEETAKAEALETEQTPPSEQPEGVAKPETPEEPLTRPLTKEEIFRPAAGALMTTLGCAFLVGGMFTGFMPRVYAALGGIVGVAMAVWAARATKREALIQGLSLGGVLLTGLLLLAITDVGAVTNIGASVSEAAETARLQVPPSPFVTGWRALLPWTVGMIGYAATWVGSMGRKPAVGVLVPIPVIAFSAIAQPSEAQIASGIVALVTFVLGLAIIFRADRGEGEGVSTAYELKRAARTLPLVLVLIAGLVGASQLNFLFPDPLYDPTQKAEKPKANPNVTDRPLFEVSLDKGFSFTGPWRMGVIDIYDGRDWRLPPYAASEFTPAPLSGLIDEALDQPVEPELKAHITLRQLEGTVLPLPARMDGIVVAEAPPLVIDRRAQVVRVEAGRLDAGLSYDITFATLPKEEFLKKAGPPDPGLVRAFADMAGMPPPPTIAAMLADPKAKKLSLWERMDNMRKKLLDTVTVAKAGLPKEVPPQKVEDMFTGTKEGTPYEIVAAQVMMARWAGVPARIGYGFDKGDDLGGGIIEYRPKHGATWLEVYIQGHGWFPITGLPKRAKACGIGCTGEQTENTNFIPDDRIAVQLFVPLRVSAKNLVFKQAQKVVLLALPFVMVFLLVWLLWPVVYKGRRRSRRRQWALELGPAARIAVAYADLRDLATDLGVGDPYATPLAYTAQVVPDEEHQELAWLITRCLWGDLRHDISDDEVLAAEELSRSVRRRLFEAQPFTIRAIALVSRLSLRNPYAPELLSPPLEKIKVTKLLRLEKVGRLLRRRRKEREILDEAVEAA